MADAACIAAILKAAPHLSRDEAAAIDDAVAQFKRQRQARSDIGSATEDAIRFAREQGDMVRAAALQEKRATAINILVEKEAWDFVSADTASARRLEAWITGSVRGFKGAAFSIDAIGKALQSRFMGFLHSELQGSGLLGLFRNADPKFERDFANELARLTDQTKGRETGNKTARELADVVHGVQERLRLAQNEAGAWIGELPGYITRQGHDHLRIRGKGTEADFGRWRDTILPLLDEKTFEGVGDRERFLHGVWTNLSTGDHLKPESVGSVKDPAFKGPANLARRLSAERILHFRDADAWMDYNAIYGLGSLKDSVLHGIHRGTQNIAILKKLGTNPEVMFDRLRDRLVLKAKEAGRVKEVDRLKSAALSNRFAQVSGATNIAENPTSAAFFAGVRAMEDMTSLGGVVLSSMSDPAMAAATLMRNGVNPLEAYTGEMAGFLQSGGDAARKAVEREGHGIDALLGDVHMRYDARDAVRGTMAKAHNFFFKLTGLPWETRSLKRGVATVLTTHMADNARLAWGELAADLRTNLLRYGIDEADWAKLRAVDTKIEGGPAMLLSERVADPDLSLKLSTFYSDQVRESLNEPGATVTSMLNQGSRPGTVIGEALRFATKYKSFAAQFAYGQVGRSLLGRAGAEDSLLSVIRSGNFDVPAVVHLMVATTVLGYASMTAKDYAKGLTPRDPLNYKTWLAAMQQGGGLGIYGDFLFGEYNRFGGGVVETLAGPAVGQVSQLARTWGVIRDGFSPEDARAEESRDRSLRLAGLNTIKQFTPFANLFYTRMAIDYLFLYQLTEMAAPGYLHRMERRIEKERHQQFIFPPSQAIPYGGGNRLFEGIQ